MAEVPVAPGFSNLPESTKEKLALLWKQAEEKGAPCVGRQEQFIDYPEDDEPTKEEAERMCYACPVRSLCLQVARETGATYGVWGGEVFTDER